MGLLAIDSTKFCKRSVDGVFNRLDCVGKMTGWNKTIRQVPTDRHVGG
mgnify:CR=1 FL=1